MSALTAKRTPLHERHVTAGAKMVEFAGYDMPLQYSAIRDEHVAVRQHAGLFDLSHMGEVQITGPGATAAVDRLVANDVAALCSGRALYGVMCRRDGGIVDDVIVYRDADDAMMVVVNASRRDHDLAWIRDHAGSATVTDRSDETALLAVQGPRAVEIVQTLASTDVAGLRSFAFTTGDVAGVPARISRTGYTGEDGVELYVDAAVAPRLWDALLEAGAPHGMVPVGLGARDTLRLEAGLRLYGQDMDDTVDPLSCGLGWTVKLDAGEFIGRDALRTLREQGGPPRRFIGLRLADRAIARHEYPVLHQGIRIGEVTSGTFGFSLGYGIATASITAEQSELVTIGATVSVDVRGSATDATVCPLPFYKRPPSAP